MKKKKPISTANPINIFFLIPCIPPNPSGLWLRLMMLRRRRMSRCAAKRRHTTAVVGKIRSKAWLELVNSLDFPEEEFKKAFRMSRATFDMICEELESVITKKDTMLRLAIPVRQRVVVCVWRLATGEALREVSKRFGLGISTCHKLVLEVCTAIRSVLMPKFLQRLDENWNGGD